ncbi:MAG: Hsp70 family protein [Proteobacteria bacterium]|nr:Hsp70 family protein [Pseudomonadota bacterium]
MSRERDKSSPDPVAEIVNRYGRRASSARRDAGGRFWQRLAESVSREPTVSREAMRTTRPSVGGAPAVGAFSAELDAPRAPPPPAGARSSSDDDLGDIDIDLGLPARAPSGAQARVPTHPDAYLPAAERAPSARALPVAEAAAAAAAAGAAQIEITFPDGSTLALAGRRLEGPEGRLRLQAADAPGNPRWLLDALSALARGTQHALQRVAAARRPDDADAAPPSPTPRPPTAKAEAPSFAAEGQGPDPREPQLDDLFLPEGLLAALAGGPLAAVEGEALPLWDGLPALPDATLAAPLEAVEPAGSPPRPHRSSVRLGGAAAEQGKLPTPEEPQPALRPSERQAFRTPSSAGQQAASDAPPTQPGKRRRPTAGPAGEAPTSERVRPARPPRRAEAAPPPPEAPTSAPSPRPQSAELRAIAGPAVPPLGGAGDERARTRPARPTHHSRAATGASAPAARASARAPALTVGVDLGNTYARVGLMRRQMELLGDAEGRRALPVVVGFPQRDEVVLGWDARELRGEHPEQTVAHFTRLLGLSKAQAEREGLLDAASLPARGGRDEELVFDAHRRELSAARLVTLLLAQLRAVASEALAQPITDAVVSVPLGLTRRQRVLLTEAAGQAGWARFSLIDAPWAALHAWGLDQHPGVVAVYDLGGSGFEFSVLQTGPPAQRRVLGMASETGVGSMLLDGALAGRVAERFGRATGIDLRARPAAWQLLLAACEDAKCQLSERNAVQVVAGELLEPELLAEAQHSMGLAYRLTRKELSELASVVVDRSLGVVVRVLVEAGLASDALSAVVLCGGGALSPLVQDAVAAFFGREPLAHDPQLAGVHGAASLGASGDESAVELTRRDD